ncbi:hypothetical protein BRADI_5g22515v3 [Brachypodium distachyon]|uniref:Uncharacterized protein n=1 Tax=Brachypodium distachyon TaxID=15368 RepID=A0A0Q3GUK0_BRADI|nr:hypothetical protein BRADI_5g22515v3 [Brachypodium distachyon]
MYTALQFFALPCACDMTENEAIDMSSRKRTGPPTPFQDISNGQDLGMSTFPFFAGLGAGLYWKEDQKIR